MNDAALQRPSVRISFRLLVAIALGLAALAFIAGRHIYQRYGGYRPMALVHVPPTMRYRARVELNDAKRVPALGPLWAALDPRATRLAALEQKLGVSARQAAHELAFGVGPGASDFVMVLGLQLQARTGLSAAKSICEVLASDGIRSDATPTGCRLADGAVVAGASNGAVVLASRADLVSGLLERPEIGDRLGFSGPSVRGAAPEPAELKREAAALSRLVATRYP